MYPQSLFRDKNAITCTFYVIFNIYFQDSKITKTEWLNMWGVCLDEIQNGPFPEWQKKYMELMFDVNDKSGIVYCWAITVLLGHNRTVLSQNCRKHGTHDKSGLLLLGNNRVLLPNNRVLLGNNRTVCSLNC